MMRRPFGFYLIMQIPGAMGELGWCKLLLTPQVDLVIR